MPALNVCERHGRAGTEQSPGDGNGGLLLLMVFGVYMGLAHLFSSNFFEIPWNPLKADAKWISE